MIPEAGAGLRDHRAGDRIVAAEQGVEAARQREHPRLVQRPALAHDLKAGPGKQLVVGARGVLE